MLALAFGARAAPPSGTVEQLVVAAPKTIAELTVTAKLKCETPARSPTSRDRPRVVSTYPARGAVVRPGLLILRVTFDQPMACSGRFKAHPPFPSPCPAGDQEMILSFDRRTVRTACSVTADGTYGVSLNRDLEGDLFHAVAGLPAESHALDFTASSSPPVESVCEALAQDAETGRQLARAHRKLDCGDLHD